MGIRDYLRGASSYKKGRELSKQYAKETGQNYGQKLERRFEQRKQSFRGITKREKVYNKQGKFTGEYSTQVIQGPSTQAGRWQQRFQRYAPRQTPSSQQRFFKARAKMLRGVQTAVPYTRIPGVKPISSGGSQGRVKQGRGRPAGTFKYFIPGRGNVDVFTYRRFISNQKQMYRQQLQQQFAMQKVANKFQQQVQPQLPQDIQQYPQQQVQLPQQQFYPQQYQKPQFAGQSVMPTEPQPLKEISILERTPVNLSGNTLQPLRETYEEVDLMTGRRTLKVRDGGLW